MKYRKGQVLADKTRTQFEYSVTVLRMYKNRMLLKDCEGNIFTDEPINYVPIGTYYEQYFRKQTNCNLETSIGIIGLCTQCGTIHKRNLFKI